MIWYLQLDYEGWNIRRDHYGILKYPSTVSKSIYYLYSAENIALFCNYLYEQIFRQYILVPS